MERDIFLSKKLLNLHDIFFRNFMVLFTIIFLGLGIIFYLWIKDIYIQQSRINLLNNIDIISLEIKDLKDVDSLIKKIQKNINLRVTIISNNGIVLGESYKDSISIDNHLNRVKINKSKHHQYSSAIRYSDTIKKELLYVSKQFNINNSIYYIRMAREIELTNKQFLELSYKIWVLFLLFIAIIFFVTLGISRKVQDETKYILEFLKNLSNQKRAIKIESFYSVEFNKITKLLTTVSQSLAKKDKQKSKYTAKLKLSNRQKDDIISAISHEFKNPISVISGYTQTLLEDKNIDQKIQDKFLNKISANSLKLTNIIDRLRLSIKLEEGKHLVNFKELNMGKIIEDIIEDLKLTYPNRDINFQSNDIKIDADETMISIAISNIIENALKYSQDNIEIKINTKNLTIVDFGIGIKESDLSKITNKFYRVSNNSWNSSLGVGLSLVKNILELHKFKLEIESVENKGSLFKIILYTKK